MDIDKEKGTKSAKIIEENFPQIDLKIFLEKDFDFVCFVGRTKDYSFSIRVKRSEYDRVSSKALADAYIEALKQVQARKENKLVRR